MNERDELAELFGSIAFPETPEERDDAEQAILDMLKPRVVTTIKELDALPAWSVIRSEQATIWEKFGGIRTGDFWAETMTLGKHPSDHIALPATVLYEPEAAL